MASLIAILAALAVVPWTGPQPVGPGDERFARDLLGSAVPGLTVLAAREWHGVFGGWGCTFAVASLPPDAPRLPPAVDAEAFGGDWRPTPLPPTSDTQRDALASCEGEWPADLAARLRAAAEEPGSWWARDEVGETVSLYAPARGLLAWVRFGD